MATTTLRIVLFALVSLASLYLGFFAFSPELSEALFRDFGYWNIAALFSAFVVSLIYGKQAAFISWIRKRDSVFLILACLTAALYLYTREGGGFKILFDEHLLSIVAQNLYRDHDPIIRESSLVDFAWFDMIDKRPLLFPFILSLVHSVFGYRVENAFYLNFALTAVFFGLLYTLLRRLANRTVARYGFMLACFMPLIEQNSSGGGFEMLNLCGFLVVAWLCLLYWESPDSRRLTQLALALALLSHIRYESVLLALPVAVLVIVSWWKQRQLTLPASIIILPLTFLPLVWQFNYVKTQPLYWQYSLEGDSSFDISYLPINIKHAMNFLFIPDTVYAGSPIIGIIGVAGLVGMIGFSITRRKAFFHGRPDRIAIIAAVVGLLLQTLLVLCFTFGQLDDRIVSRLGLPLVLLLIACGAFSLGYVHKANKALRAVAISIAIGAASYAFTMYSQTNYTDENRLHRRIEMALDFADKLPEGNYLFISNLARVFELEGYNNLSISTARQRIENIALHLKLKTYDEVFIIQHGSIELDENGDTVRLLNPNSEFEPAAKLETIVERSLLAHNFTRISRISGFDFENPGTPETATRKDGDKAGSFHLISPEEMLRWTNSLP